jgi:polar amino acid transport system permease protein
LFRRASLAKPHVQAIGWNEVSFIVLAARWTLLLALIAFVGGAAGEILVAVLRTSTNRLSRWCATSFIYLVQGTPLLMQLYIWYFGINLVGLRVPGRLSR